MPIRPGVESLEASFRVDPVGGDVSDVAGEQVRLIRQRLNGGTATGLVVLVHGYNNNREQADAAYEGFFALQKKIASLPPNRPLADNKIFVEVYWAGDADWGFASFLFYMGAVGNAKVTGGHFGALLAKLADRPEPLEVQLVGHSLGCRVVFELLRHVGGIGNVHVTRAVFMAAAVPLSLLEAPADQQRLRYHFDQVMRRSLGASRSLYSPDDVVLAGAFPLGQSLAKGPEGFMPVALGRDFWQALVEPQRFTQYQVLGANHSDYWGWNANKLTQADDAQRQVHEFLGFNFGGERRTARREPGSRDIDGREGGAIRTVDTRALPETWQP